MPPTIESTESVLQSVVQVVHHRTRPDEHYADALAVIARAGRVVGALVRALASADRFVASNGQAVTKEEYHGQ